MTSEKEERKHAIFDQMSPRQQARILRLGYERWDPFQLPKDPIDLRRDKTRRTTQELVREFLQWKGAESPGSGYARGALEICLGLINEDERFQGMFDFSCWYFELLRREGDK